MMMPDFTDFTLEQMEQLREELVEMSNDGILLQRHFQKMGWNPDRAGKAMIFLLTTLCRSASALPPEEALDALIASCREVFKICEITANAEELDS